MTISRLIEAKPGSGKQLTLGDVKQFAADLDRVGADERTPVFAVVTWGGRLRMLKAKAVRFGDPDD